ncbi:MAG: CidA/LrgA family protein [Pseudoflavonifractor sp.]|nr:CidA/LrgA family protein [Pseudoflavonifractor sp.]MDY3019759.1 CidA/LrgA family protein [Oscillospiraceae bacterium]
MGEVLHTLIPLPIPASVYGLVLMFLALCSGAVKLRQVHGAATFLIGIMPILFVPPLVGLVDAWGLIRPILLPTVGIIAASTALVMAVTGLTAQGILHLTRNREELSREEEEGEQNV